MNRRPNLNRDIVNGIVGAIGVPFVADEDLKTGCLSKLEDDKERLDSQPVAENDKNNTVFSPIDVMDYIYAVLHSPNYRETYKEFLKIDFPRVPYPKDAKTFFALGKLGAELRQLHLMTHPRLSKLITTYPISGNNTVDKVRFENGEIPASAGMTVLGRVYINVEQYFDGVPQNVWEFYIGGYQVCHKWLKDRNGTELSFDDIVHYQKIIVSLHETIRIMTEIDSILFV